MSSRSLRPTGRKLGVAALSATLGLAGLGLAATPVAADTVDTVVDDCGRLAGQTRFGTAGTIADAYDAESPTDHAIVANGFNFPDALAASGLGRELNAPVLLVNQDSVPLETASALEDLGIASVTIVGGTAAVSQGVEDALAAEYTVDREAGTDRYETARDIALAIAEVGQHDGLNTAIIATGNNYPDALAGGPVAYHGDGTNPFPILLTNGDEIPAATQEALDAHEIEQVIVLGGTDAVPATVVAELGTSTGNPPIVLAGTTREGTAQEVADFAVAELGFAPDAVLLADGRLRFPSPDALTGGPLGGVVEAPILLVNPGMPPQTEAFITENADAIQQVIALGGTEAISAEVLNAGCEAGGVPIPGETNQAFTVTPGEAATQEAGTTRQFSLSGLDDAETYTVELFECDNVTTDENGIVTFAEDGTTNTADPGTVDGEITVVNGQATAGTPTQVADVSPVNGAISFTVEGNSGCIVAVVYNDADGDGVLDLDADNLPTEDFGVGGQTTFIPAEATAGQAVDGAVTAVAADGSYAILDTDADGVGDVTVYFRDGDVYRIETAASFCQQVTEDVFFQNLSVGDNLETHTGVAGYGTSPAPYNDSGANEFCAQDVAPAAPTALTAAAGDPSDTVIDLSWTASADADSYNVYANDEACADTLAAELGLIGSTTEVTFEATGLTPDTTYCFVVTAVSGNDESVVAAGTAGAGDDNTVEAATDATPTQATISAADLDVDAPLEGIADTGDEWTIAFTEDIDVASLADATISLTDVDGDTILVECNDSDATAAGAFVTGATCTVEDGDGAGPLTTNVVRVELVEDAADRNAAGDGDIEYALTITAITGVADANDGATVSATGDTTID